MEEVVEVGHPPVTQRVWLCRWILIKLHDFGVGWSHRLVSPRAQGRRPITGLFCLLVADRGLVLITGEDASRHRLSAGRRFHQRVGCLVETPQDVIELETVELILQPAAPSDPKVMELDEDPATESDPLAD